MRGFRPEPREPPTIVVLLAVLVCALSVSMPRSAEEQGETPPKDSGVVEKTEVTLQLLDVEVVDRKGNPIPGLTKEDFTVYIDGVQHAEIYSVDDLCPCGTSVREGTGADAPRATPPDALALARQEESSFTTYVLYFDVSQLQLAGRERAFTEGKRWVEESLPDGRPATIAVYHNDLGLQRVEEATTDKTELLARLDRARTDVRLVDAFPSDFGRSRKICEEECRAARRSGCRDTCDLCAHNACRYPFDWYLYESRSLSALGYFLQTIERIPGRKALILFTENIAVYPGRTFPVDSARVRDLVSALDRVAAEANQARTAVFPAFVGDELAFDAPSPEAINFGANLADFTGGAYNKSLSRLKRLTDSIAERCACIYRIAIVPNTNGDKVHRISVTAAGGKVPFRYRVEFLDDVDRWWRLARGILRNPAIATELPVEAIVLPLHRDDDGWAVRAGVAVDLDSLMLLPGADSQRGSWEIGALLYRESGGTKWEMLGKSDVRIVGTGATDTEVVHEREFDGLKPGAYRIGAFVRDRTANVFGGGEAVIDLPSPERPGVVGPLILDASKRILRSELPLMKDSEAKPTGTTQLETEPVVVGDRTFDRDQAIEFRSWICPGKGSGVGAVQRFVSGSGEPLFRFDSEQLAHAGDCFAMRDVVETHQLPPGQYRYHLRWRQADGSEAVERTEEFEVARTANGPD